jgi:4'-phosphopantetheinyl transferase EntD
MNSGAGIAELEGVASAIGERLALSIGLVGVAGRGRTPEHVAGRLAARRAFGRAGSPHLEVVGSEPDGRPKWPEGWTGSISHGAGVAIAAVAQSGRPVGIDVERSAALALDEADLVLTDSEVELAAGAPDPAAVTTLIWSAKEAAFKAWSTAAGGLEGVDPRDILIEADLASGRIEARACGRLRRMSRHQHLAGASVTVRGILLTVIAGGEGRMPFEGEVA